jgi:aquaporin Z
VFNPAVAVGVATAGLVSWSMLWVYLVANLAGAALAAGAYRLLNPDDLAEPIQPPVYEHAAQIDKLGQLNQLSQLGSADPDAATTPARQPSDAA